MFFDEEEDSAVSKDSTVLLMHDDQMTIQIKTALLKYLGYSAETVTAGEEAVALYKARKEEGRPFKAVIFDICHPECIQGCEAVKDLMEYDPEVNAIASSGLNEYKIMTEPDEYGDQGSLFKPYNLRQLGAALRNSAGSGDQPRVLNDSIY
jgi:DNA-binding NtrC family response regulator